MAAAAYRSSRDARSRKPSEDSRYQRATSSTSTAPMSATGSVVNSSRPKKVRGPLVTLSHWVITTCMTISVANSVMTPAASDSRMSGHATTAATSAATTPPMAMAISGCGICSCTSTGYMLGTPRLLTIGAIDRMPDTYAPMPIHPTCVQARMPELPMKICSPSTIIRFTQKYV